MEGRVDDDNNIRQRHNSMQQTSFQDIISHHRNRNNRLQKTKDDESVERKEHNHGQRGLEWNGIDDGWMDGWIENTTKKTPRDPS